MTTAPATPFAPPSPDRLLSLVDAMRGQHVAMAVDLVADRFIHGTPKRISREAPVLILRHDAEVFAPGGGANAVANVAALGGRPFPLGVVGDDQAGAELCAWLTRHEVSTTGVLTRAGYRTPTKTRVLAGGRHAIKQQIVRFDVEDTITLTPDERARFGDALRDARHAFRAAVFSDYGYGGADPALLDAVRPILGPDCPVLGDSRYRLADFAGLDGATPNAEEAEALLGHTIEDRAQLVSGGGALRDRLGMGFLLVTRGSDGMTLLTADGAAHLPVHGTDQVADVTGAGDTVIGTFALALAAGATPLEAACLANYAGGVVVMKVGTATLDRAELAHAVTSNSALLEGIRWDA